MKLSREFFHLQLRFAEQMARVLHVPLADALLKFSTLYMSLELGRSFSSTHPTWQEYLSGLQPSVENNVEWTHTFYVWQYIEHYPENCFGCFNYAYSSDAKMVRLHFVNRNTSGYSALNKEQMQTRLQELTALFTHVSKSHPEAEAVRGRSWLYNIQSYRRLFPVEYTHNTKVAVDGEFPFMALWGQFLDRHGQVREQMAHDFLACVARQETFDGIKHCFPFLPLAPQCSIHHFYTFYKIL